MSIFLIASIAIASLVCPFALAYVWVMRLWDEDGERGSRAVLGWLSLALVTSAVIVYWLSLSFSFGNPGGPEWDVHFHHWSRISIGVVALGFLCGVFGSGKEKWVVLAASFVVPLSWAVVGALR
ncbi:MAG TPA: hypothetical protein VJP02_04285 [Candidatus Sulfotelmatobacter sp.]|nr:hypothetical protein [Candidatus Sulfotelmatobacter sp.]